MRRFLQFRPPNCGVDLGSSWGKTVKLVRQKKTPTLDRFARFPWLDQQHQSPDQKGTKLQTLWRHLGLKDKSVISSLAGHAVMVKRIFLQAGPEKEIQEKISQEAAQYIPFDINDVYLDYHVLDSSSESENQEVILVASKKKVVQELGQIMEHSGLNLSIADVDAFALSNCFEFNYPELTQEPAYLLDIGGQQSIFAVFWHNQPLFFREMSLGGNQLTEAIAKILDVDSAQAEKIKLEGPDACSQEEKKAVSRECVNILRSWASEIKRLIGFYQTSFPSAKQAKILLLSGGGSLLQDIEKTLEQELKIETRHLDPWKNIQIQANDFDPKYLEMVKPQFAVPTGLALRGFI